MKIDFIKTKLELYPRIYVYARYCYTLYKRFVAPRLFKWKLSKNEDIRVVIGASGRYDKGWIPSDVEYLDLLTEKNWERFFIPNSIDKLMAEHVWEHMTIDEGLEAAKRCFKYLRFSGYLRVAVPDGFHPNHDYINRVKVGGIGPGAQDHKYLYNYKSFGDIFINAGFRVILYEYFDENGLFHYHEWYPADGMIYRSKRFDPRNVGNTEKYTSIILDARKV